jgi:hypothetical protein
MLEPPFKFDPSLSPEDFQKIGQLAIRWAHIEHIIGHCLRKILRLSHEEAAIAVFPLSFDQRIEKIKSLSELKPLRDEAEDALYELLAFRTAIQTVRTNVLHAWVDSTEDGDHSFFVRSKNRTLTKQQIFSAEEITNYVAHAALALRYGIGLNVDPALRHPLPDRPAVPAFLQAGLRPPRPRRASVGQTQQRNPHLPSDT